MTDFSSSSLAEFLDALASDAPTPGGGTAAAVAAAMGAALAEMVAALTLSKEKYAASHEAVRPIAEAARKRAGNSWRSRGRTRRPTTVVVAARRLPRSTEEEKAERATAIAGSQPARHRGPDAHRPRRR